MRTTVNYSIASVAILGWALIGPVSAEEGVEVKKEEQPTRLIDGDVSKHVDMLRARLAISTQERGPFGLFQKPGKEPVKAFVSPAKKLRTVVIPFDAVVDALTIAAVMPSDKMFMVGSRSLRVGQTLPLVAGGRTFRTRVEHVRSDQIGFRNLEDNEMAVKRLDLLPDGVSAGGGKLTPQGVIPSNGGSAEPLQVDLMVHPPSPTK